MKRLHILAVIAAALSFSLLGVASAQNIDAWLKVELRLPATNWTPGFGIPDGLEVRLETTRDSSYRQVFCSECRHQFARWNTDGTVTFLNVPTGVPVRLTVTYRHPSLMSRSAQYAATYRFTEPNLNIVQQLRRERAYKIAGYMGHMYANVAYGTLEMMQEFP